MLMEVVAWKNGTGEEDEQVSGGGDQLSFKEQMTTHQLL